MGGMRSQSRRPSVQCNAAGAGRQAEAAAVTGSGGSSKSRWQQDCREGAAHLRCRRGRRAWRSQCPRHTAGGQPSQWAGQEQRPLSERPGLQHAADKIKTLHTIKDIQRRQASQHSAKRAGRHCQLPNSSSRSSSSSTHRTAQRRPAAPAAAPVCHHTAAPRLQQGQIAGRASERVSQSAAKLGPLGPQAGSVHAASLLWRHAAAAAQNKLWPWRRQQACKQAVTGTSRQRQQQAGRQK
jgi:hypothetical protein